MKKKHKSKIPAFIPNQPMTGWFGLDSGERDKIERQKQFENQKKLALRNRK
jgi:hypothetical protein